MASEYPEGLAPGAYFDPMFRDGTCQKVERVPGALDVLLVAPPEWFSRQFVKRSTQIANLEAIENALQYAEGWDAPRGVILHTTRLVDANLAHLRSGLKAGK